MEKNLSEGELLFCYPQVYREEAGDRRSTLATLTWAGECPVPPAPARAARPEWWAELHDRRGSRKEEG